MFYITLQYRDTDAGYHFFIIHILIDIYIRQQSRAMWNIHPPDHICSELE